MGNRKSNKDPQEQSNQFCHLKLIPISLNLLKYTLQSISAFLTTMQKEKHTGSSMCLIQFSVQIHIHLLFI